MIEEKVKQELIGKYEEVVSTGKVLKGKVETTIDYIVGEEPVETKKMVGEPMYAKVEGDTVYLVMTSMCCGPMPYELLAGAEKLPEFHGKKMVIFYTGDHYSSDLKSATGICFSETDKPGDALKRYIHKMEEKIAAGDLQYSSEKFGSGSCPLQLVGSFELIKKKFAPVSITAVHITDEYEEVWGIVPVPGMFGVYLPATKPEKIPTGKKTIDEIVEIV